MSETETVKRDLETLKQVQVLDKQIYDMSQDLLNIPAELTVHQQEFETAKKSVEAREAALKTARLKQKEKELELAQKEEHIQKLQGQLMQVKTNKEYSAIQHEIATAKADDSVLEEVILKLMDEVEQSAGELATGQDRLKQEEKKLEAKKAECRDRKKSFEEKIVELQAKKKTSMDEVSRETASLYEKILVKKQGVALAAIDGENCSSCRITLRAQVQNEVRLKEAIIVCENCSRILYDED
jgi:predicted  nucleic acid-binding Zn-ribbon protein